MASVNLSISRNNGTSISANGEVPDADVLDLARALATLLSNQVSGSATT